MNPTATEPAQREVPDLFGDLHVRLDRVEAQLDALDERQSAQQGTLADVPGVTLPELTVTQAAKAPSFAALMGAFRREHDSEVEAAAALLIGPSTLSDYCDGKSLPTANGIKRLAPLVGIPADELAELVEAQRAAQARGEPIATVAPVRTRKVRVAPVRPNQNAEV